MMKAKLTTAEILSRTIRSIEDEIRIWEERAAGNTQMASMTSVVTDPLYAKLETAKMLYEAETGKSYGD